MKYGLVKEEKKFELSPNILGMIKKLNE